MTSKPILTDVKTLRSQARKHIDDGAVTAGYAADRLEVLKLLNEALATEMVCVLRYRRHHFMARGIHAKSTAEEFLVHSDEELGHADLLAERIVQLGGEPDLAAPWRWRFRAAHRKWAGPMAQSIQSAPWLAGRRAVGSRPPSAWRRDR